MQYNAENTAATVIEAAAETEGRYLYCVADARDRVSLGKIGIADNEVFTIPYKDICAVVHVCPPLPYRSDDQEMVKTWIMAHQRVVDTAWERWGTVLPLTFDIIIKGHSAERNVEAWLEQEYERLKRTIEKVRGKAEYGVQVFWDVNVVARTLTQTSPEIRKLREEIGSKSRGLAYMCRQKLEKLIQKELETKADERFRDFYSRIRQHVDDLRVEKTKNGEPGWQMILNLSCLVRGDRHLELGQELDRINRLDGFLVRFTGPWPPYSFVGGA